MSGLLQYADLSVHSLTDQPRLAYIQLSLHNLARLGLVLPNNSVFFEEQIPPNTHRIKNKTLSTKTKPYSISIMLEILLDDEAAVLKHGVITKEKDMKNTSQ